MAEEKYGHRKMVVWQNIDQLCPIVNRLVDKIPKWHYKLAQQIEAAIDSVGSNFVEGYYCGSILDYLRFLRYAKRSLAEVQERVRRSYLRDYFQQHDYLIFDDLAIRTMYLFDRLIYALDKKARGKKAAEGIRRQ